MRYQAPRGTQDILPPEQPHWRYVADTAQALAHRFGYGRIDTPAFEQAGLFVRSVGQGTDIVEKEMYTFLDRGGTELTLRPEGTAPVCRTYLERGMHTWPQPVRLYYFCPVFRYERPQAGRFRQHHQFGVEAIGDADPAVDAEVIELGWRFIANLGLTNMTLLINSIGDHQCRPAHLDALRAYYQPHVDAKRVCPDCLLRYERNVLRMLDCKRTDFDCQDLMPQAPRTTSYLCDDCARHWEKLQGHLRTLDLPFQVRFNLVRGLDYYTRTVFEIQPQGVEGAQNTVLAGGRYDGLIEELGGRSTPGIGFGSGLERLILNVKRQETPVPDHSAPDAVIVALGDAAQAEAMRLAGRLRAQGLRVVLAPAGRSMRGQLRHATALDARYTLIIGDDEIANAAVQVKHMATGDQRQLPTADVAAALTSPPS